MKQAYDSSSVCNVCSDIILSILVASLVPFPLLNPNWFLQEHPQFSFSILLSILATIFVLSILATIFAVCVMRLIVWWSLHL
jgi:hypothetical protein